MLTNSVQTAISHRKKLLHRIQLQRKTLSPRIKSDAPQSIDILPPSEDDFEGAIKFHAESITRQNKPQDSKQTITASQEKQDSLATALGHLKLLFRTFYPAAAKLCPVIQDSKLFFRSRGGGK